MRERVEVVESISDLERIVWTFWYRPGLGAMLDYWRHERRTSRRHKFVSTRFDGTTWSRLRPRDNRVSRPVVSPAIAAEALRLFRESVCFAPQEIENGRTQD